MGKITCEVASDLLPLYCDEVCTNDSRRLVEEHLRECAHCQALLGKMQSECGTIKIQEQEEAHILKDMASAWKKTLLKSFIKGLAAASAVLLSLFAYWVLVNWPLVCIPPQDVRASAVVEDSRFTIRLDTSNGYKVPSADLTTTEDGILYIVLKHALVPVKNGKDADYGGTYAGSMNSETEAGHTVRIKEIYYGTKDDCRLLWKE